MFGSFGRVVVASLLAMLLVPVCLVAQNAPPSGVVTPIDTAPPPSPSAGGAPVSSGSDTALSPADLETLVARIALYPDDLVAIVLPAATQPLQVVQAKRLLDQRKNDPTVQPPKSWDPSVVALLNYPEIVAMMNADLGWLEQLGTAVIDQQDGVLDAIQSFRKKAQAAGNLKSDDKQTVTTQSQEQTIIIEPANPEVVYVPSYNPTTVVYPPQPAAPPPYAYYPAPYPPYWAPGAAFFTGMFFGAAIGYGLSWSDHGIYHGDVNINNSTNINRNTERGNRNRVEHNGDNRWRPSGGEGARPDSGAGNRGPGVAARPTTQQIQGGLASRGGAGGQFGGPAGGRAPGPAGAPAGAGRGNFAPGAGAGGGSFNRASPQRPSGAFQGTNRSAAATRSYSSRGSASLGRSGGSAPRAAARGGGGGRGRR